MADATDLDRSPRPSHRARGARGAEPLQWPAVNLSANVEVVLADVWRSLPGDLPRIMPLAVGAALLCGVAITVFSPKLGRVLTYTMVGLSILFVMGVTALRMSRPDWLVMFPRSFPTQAAILLGMVLIGVMIQWRLTPAGGLAGGGGGAKE